jgi:hypothetical protein
VFILVFVCLAVCAFVYLFSSCIGDVESTEPTKSLMRIAEYLDTHERKEELRVWFLEQREEVLDMLSQEEGRVARERGRTLKPRWVYRGGREGGRTGG